VDLSTPNEEENLMRKASTCLVALGLALLALPAVASALPTVTFKAKAVPIKGFPHTGNILGAGAALQAEYAISGTEYAGSPPPVIGINFYLPKGSKLHTSGFPTCSKNTLEQFGPVKCKKSSAAGPIGKVTGFVSFGGERVVENAELSSFYAPGGGIEFFTDGHSPVSLEIGHVDQREGRLRVQVERQNDLLRAGADQVPQRRLPAEDRSDLRRKR
jgi:hypothetical protein